MQTTFSALQLEDPDVREADRILRTCVHCGFCTATCPTYLLLGDERDGPRGRIYLIKNMLESGGDPGAGVVRHVDRCLSCLGCMTTCPSGVHYMHLVDHARAYIERHHVRRARERWLRRLLGFVLPRPRLLVRLLAVARIAAPLARRLPGRAGAMAAYAAAARLPRAVPVVATTSSPAPRRGRVGFLPGCVQQALGADVNAATVRVLARLGYEVETLADTPCCGAVEHHLGLERQARARVADNVARWRAGEFDAIVVNASGCGTMVKDYGYLLREDGALAADATRVSEMARDVMELLDGEPLPGAAPHPLRIAYHPPCSLYHGQRVTAAPRRVLARLGFEVVEAPEGHLCCGSAGTYNLLQPELSAQLGARKAERIRAVSPQAVTTGNLGCMLQIGRHTALPVVHPIELVDWALGGPEPQRLARR